MAESSVIGLLRVLLTADAAQFTPVMRSATTDVQKLGTEAKKTEGLVKSSSSGLQAFSDGLKDITGGLRDVGGQANPLTGILGKLQGVTSGLAGGITALGPAGAAAAIGIGALAAGTVAAVAIVGTVGAKLIEMTRASADAGDELLRLSNRTGISVEALSKFQFIAQQTDTSVDTITATINRLGQNLASGSKQTTSAIRSIGLSVDDIRKLKPDQAFNTIITAIGKVPDAGKRAAAGVAIFGKQFREIAQLTREDMAGLGKQAEDLGLVFTEEFAVAGDRFNDAMGAVGMTVDALKTRLGAEFLPVAIAFVETFGKAFTDALIAAGKTTGGLTDIISDAAIAIGQALASIIEVGAPVVAWLVQFFAGKFIANMGLIDLFGSVIGAIGKVAGVMASFSPEMLAVSVAADKAATGIHNFTASATVGVATAVGSINEYAAAVSAAAKKTGAELPDAVARVRKEIADTAAQMRQAQADAGGFGNELGDLSDQQKAAAKAAEDHRKEVERLDDLLSKRGVLSVSGYSKALGDLIEVLNLAARVGTPALQQALEALGPEFAKLRKNAQESGQDVAALDSALEGFLQKAGLAQLATDTIAWERAMVDAGGSLDDILAKLPRVSVEAEGMALAAQVSTDAWHEFGMKTPAELQKAADAARLAYRQIVAEVGANAPAAIAAHEKMVEAINAATGRIPSYWESTVLPRVREAVDRIGAQVSQSFAAMLVHARGFRDGFLDIWSSIKQGVIDILASILDNFINSFLKGLLGALMGQQGAFGKAFAGLFGGGGGVPGMGGGGLENLLLKGAGKLLGLGGGAALAGAPGTVTAGIPSMAGVGVPVNVGGTAGVGAGGGGAGLLGPAWGSLAGAGVGAGVGFGVGTKTGSAAGGAAAGAASGFGAGMAFGGPIGGLVGAGVGALAGWYAAQRARKQANNDRDAYFQAYADELGKPFTGGTDIGSTFNDLAAELTKATGEAGGGTLFKNLLKANDAEELANAIDAVNKKLAEYRAATGDAAAGDQAHSAVIAAKTAELEKQQTAIEDQRKALDTELADISAKEAPEAHMGTREKLARERIAREKADLDAQLADLQAKFDASVENLKTAAGGIAPAVQPGVDKIGELGPTIDEQAGHWQTFTDASGQVWRRWIADSDAALGQTQTGLDNLDTSGVLGKYTDCWGTWRMNSDGELERTQDGFEGLSLGGLTEKFGDTWGVWDQASEGAFAGTEADAAGAADTVFNEFRDAAGRSERVLNDIDVDPIVLRYRYKREGPDLPDGSNLPGHALGGVFSRPHVAMIAEGGQPEIVGSEQFMARAIAGALGSRGLEAGGGTKIFIVPIQGTPSDDDVTRFIATAKRAEPRIAGNEGGVRTAFRDATGIR